MGFTSVQKADLRYLVTHSRALPGMRVLMSMHASDAASLATLPVHPRLMGEGAAQDTLEHHGLLLDFHRGPRHLYKLPAVPGWRCCHRLRGLFLFCSHGHLEVYDMMHTCSTRSAMSPFMSSSCIAVRDAGYATYLEPGGANLVSRRLGLGKGYHDMRRADPGFDFPVDLMIP